jgi:hydrogenase/urease accessory protein HupE
MMRLSFMAISLFIATMPAAAHPGPGGHVHDTDMTAGLSPVASGLGFLLASAPLLLVGMAIAQGLRRYLTSSTEVRAPRTTS